MATLYRTGIPHLRTVRRVMFHEYIPVTTSFKLPEKYVSSDGIMNDVDFIDNICNKSVKRTLQWNRYELDKNHYSLITKFLEEDVKSEDRVEKIKNEIKTNTFYEQGLEHWNVTNLCRKYQMSGKDVFLTMVSNTLPYGNGFANHNPDDQTIKKLEQVWETTKKNSREYVHFDWVNGVGVKNSFPIDINVSMMRLNMRRFNDRNYYIGYNRFLNLLNRKIDMVENNTIMLKDYERYEETYSDEIVDDVIDDVKLITPDDYDKYVEMIKKHELVEECIPDIKQYYYNHRNKMFDDDPVWDYAVFEDETYKTFVEKGIENNAFDLDRYFMYHFWPINYDYEKRDEYYANTNNYNLVPRYSTSLKNLSIVNCLIFGKTNIRKEDVERMLTFVRFNKDSYKYYLDNYIVNIFYYCEKNGRTYSIDIESDNEKLNNMKFSTSYIDKFEAARAIIKVMNEIEPSLINHHNYNMIVKYIERHDNGDHEFRTLIWKEKNRIESTTFE